ncbi:hypothetical protein LOZ12_002749 [Ophidiomyces ophidiicola]|nr:hypothetical protein LOZ64_004862 [Ophidiomyces ophidiicola]KAI1935456.1 hypothetical protein LOZ62_005983 [Ophidiomyces ophidiicola]KAI2000351.1 hypothetical protein LOZ50_006002 [Ophidiomyces ophidiicola]KAI2013735.1 hypothetical protein LOZ49_001805 [Ophidiomyces ophidiicola]KAI2014482.1 hypothetical protein LOZ46_005530 [Ophidiomyces ophidiicola]
MNTPDTPLDPTSPKSPEPKIHSIQCSPHPADRLPTPIFNSQPASINEEYARIIPLTTEYLEQLGELPATPDSSPTLVSAEENTGENADEDQHQSSIQNQQILSQTSFTGPDISPIIEQPRPAETIIYTPHQCALGIDCLLEINNLNYHRVLATSLVTRARLACLSVRPINPDDDYDDIARLRGLSRHSANLLQEHYVETLKIVMNHFERFNSVHRPTTRTEMLNPVNIMKEIQFPEYWETESRYLENPGCLLERQKTAVSIEPLPCSSSEADNRKLLGDGPQGRLTSKRKLAEVDPKAQENMSKRRRSSKYIA